MHGRVEALAENRPRSNGADGCFAFRQICFNDYLRVLAQDVAPVTGLSTLFAHVQLVFHILLKLHGLVSGHPDNLLFIAWSQSPMALSTSSGRWSDIPPVVIQRCMALASFPPITCLTYSTKLSLVRLGRSRSLLRNG